MTTSPLFKRVPVEPTPEIIEAMAKARCLDYDKDYFDEEERAEVREWVRNEWDAALAASPEPPAESAWRTIESAPAGVEVLVCGIGSAGYYVALAKKIDGHWMIFCSEDDAFTLLSSGHSHWQPLPAPPALSNKG